MKMIKMVFKRLRAIIITNYIMIYVSHENEIIFLMLKLVGCVTKYNFCKNYNINHVMILRAECHLKFFSLKID